MTSDDTASEAGDRHRQALLEIREDPQIRVFALRQAGDPDVAEDALQSAYYAVAGLEHPEEIENLKAYFLRALRNEIRRQLGGLNALSQEDFLREDPHGAVGSGIAQAGLPGAREWLERLSADRDRLTAAIPRRSPDPDRYRELIIAVAEQVLGAIMGRHDSEPDSKEALGAAYPEWFSAVGSSPATRDQRFARARYDVRSVIQAVVSRADLDPEPAPAPRIARAATPPAAAQLDDRANAADDATLSALFHASEHVRLPDEAPYDVEQELRRFTEWLDSEE